MHCSCDYESPAVYQATTPVARKAHRCYECGSEIKPGERYERVWGVWEGEPGTYKTCARCLDLREWVTAHVPCTCWEHGNIIENAIETARDYAGEAPGLLFGAYRRKLIIQRNRRATRKTCWRTDR